MKHLGTTSFFLLALSACAPTTTPTASTSTSTDPLAALPAGFADDVLSARCFEPLDDLVAFNPGTTRAAWITRNGGDIAYRSAHVVVDNDAVAACRAVLDGGDDCHAVDAACLPLSRFFVGQLDTNAACSSFVECASGTCVGAGIDGGCGVCGDCRLSEDCGADADCINGLCTRRRAAGEACEVGDACVDDLRCIGGTCEAPRALGEACTTSNAHECVDDLICGDGACAPRPRLGEPCDNERWCDEGSCSDGVCTAFVDSCVDDESCSRGTRCHDGLCEPAVEGDGCEYSDFGGCGDDLFCDAGRCVPTHARGDSCLIGPQAQAGCDVDAGCFIIESGGTPRCLAFDGRTPLGGDCSATLCDVGSTCALDDDGIHRCVANDTFGRTEGDACRNDLVLPTCAWPNICGDDDVCVRPAMAALGEACSDTIRCADERTSSWCVDEACVARPAVGEPCDYWHHDTRSFFNVCADGASCSSDTWTCTAIAPPPPAPTCG